MSQSDRDPGGDAGAGSTPGSGSAPVSTPVRQCTEPADHTGSSRPVRLLSRVGACVLTVVGVVFVGVGAVGILAQVVDLGVGVLRADVGAPAAFGTFLTGLVVLGRRRLVSNLAGVIPRR